MEVLLYISLGIIIAFIFRALDRFLVNHLFSIEGITVGKIGIKHPLFIGLIPISLMLIFELIIPIGNPYLFFLPGFFASFLIGWPLVYSPENIPLELARQKGKLNFLLTTLILSFSGLSFIGGILGSCLASSSSPLACILELKPIYWFVLFLSFSLLYLRKKVKL